MLGKQTSALALWLSFIVVLLGSTLCYDENNGDLAQEVISALNRVLDFYHRDYKSINLDGIFGLRVAQGAFLSLINDTRDSQLNADDRVVNQVKGLYNKASLVAQDALPFLQQSEPDYFKKFRKQVSNPWVNFKPFTNKKLEKRHYEREGRRNVISFDEETSDQCLSELTGTASNSDVSQPCQISDRCWGLISAEGAEGYTLTHQALFLMVGEIQGCTSVMLKRLEQSHIKGGLEQVYNRICSDMYPQMTAIEQMKTSEQASYQRDLYMEQAMVCGSIGYHDFLSSKRLRHILTWQRNDGCFGDLKQVDQDDDGNQETDVGDQQSEVLDNSDVDSVAKMADTPFGDFRKNLNLGYQDSKILRKPLSMKTMRSLLVEKELNDGCLSHITGVASGLLGVYLRWLLYPHGQPFDNQRQMEMKKSQVPGQSKETDEYVNNLADIIERQQRRRQKMTQDGVQSEHLQRMRKATMLENSAQELLTGDREGPGSIHWGVIVLGCTFVVFAFLLIKGFNIVKTITHHARKTTHVI